MQNSLESRLAKGLPFANFAWIAAYLLIEQSVPFPRRYASIVVIGLLVSAALPCLLAWGREKFARAALNLNVSALFIGLSLAAVELFFHLVPGSLPNEIRNLVAESAEEADKARVVEYLPFNPYAKPRANVTIHVPGDYGPADSFTYEWTTDRRGFKNPSKIAALAEVPAVAIGDSFTEGLGVPTNDTWTAQLTAAGYPTYSLGVQGYAPSQFLGTFEHFGLPLKPRWVIIGYLAGDSGREAHFLEVSRDRAATPPKSLPSAIGRLVAADKIIEEGGTTFFVTKDGYDVPVVVYRRHTFYVSAMVTLATRTLWIKTKYDRAVDVAEPAKDARFVKDIDLFKPPGARLTKMSRYSGEFEALESGVRSEAQYENNPHWKSTMQALKRIVDLGRANNVKPLLVVFPSRPAVYYEVGTGKKLPANTADNVEAALLRKFSADNGVAYLDLGPVFRNYMTTLSDEDSYADLPFLKYDGHPTARGHQLIANAIGNFFANSQSSSKALR